MSEELGAESKKVLLHLEQPSDGLSDHGGGALCTRSPPVPGHDATHSIRLPTVLCPPALPFPSSIPSPHHSTRCITLATRSVTGRLRLEGDLLRLDLSGAASTNATQLTIKPQRRRDCQGIQLLPTATSPPLPPLLALHHTTPPTSPTPSPLPSPLRENDDQQSVRDQVQGHRAHIVANLTAPISS
jgi:hypothetical protein